MDLYSESLHEGHLKPPLHIAVSEIDIVVVKFLLEKCGVDVNSLNSEGNDALFWAIKCGSRDMVDYLARCGADLTNGLHTAVELDKSYLCMYFISRGVNVNARTSSGQTPIAMAFAAKNYAIANVLLDARARIGGVFRRGNTAVHCSVLCENLDLVKRICSLDTEFNARNDCGNTALHIATIHGLYDIARHLVVDCNVRLDIQDVDYQTPFTIAVNMGYPDIAVLLLNAGYFPSQSDRVRLNTMCRQYDKRFVETVTAVAAITNRARSLKHLAVFTVRHCLGSGLLVKTDSLPIPETVKKHITLSYL